MQSRTIILDGKGVIHYGDGIVLTGTGAANPDAHQVQEKIH